MTRGAVAWLACGPLLVEEEEGESPSAGVRAGSDTAAAQPTQDVAQDAGQDVAKEKSEPRGAGRKLIERALVDLEIDWEDVMSYQVHNDRVVIVEGPVGFKRTWWFPASGEKGRA